MSLLRVSDGLHLIVEAILAHECFLVSDRHRVSVQVNITVHLNFFVRDIDGKLDRLHRLVLHVRTHDYKGRLLGDNLHWLRVDLDRELDGVALTPLVPCIVLNEDFKDVPHLDDLTKETSTEAVHHRVALPVDSRLERLWYLFEGWSEVIMIRNGQLDRDLFLFMSLCTCFFFEYADVLLVVGDGCLLILPADKGRSLDVPEQLELEGIDSFPTVSVITADGDSYGLTYAVDVFVKCDVRTTLTLSDSKEPANFCYQIFLNVDLHGNRLRLAPVDKNLTFMPHFGHLQIR